MDDLDLASKILTYLSMTLSVSWFALHLNEIVGVITIITLISAIVANIAKTKRYNSERRIQEYEHLDRELHKNDEEKPD